MKDADRESHTSRGNIPWCQLGPNRAEVTTILFQLTNPTANLINHKLIPAILLVFEFCHVDMICVDAAALVARKNGRALLHNL